MRRLRFVLGLTAAVVGASWACVFPEVTFGTEPADEAGTDGAQTVPGEASLPDDDASPLVDEDSGPILIDGSTLDALVVLDAGGKVDAAGCTGCDCDDDKYNDLGKPGCASAGGQNDCDDNDTRSHPLQGYLFDKAESPRNGDWDCNGGVEKLYTREDTTCAGLTLGLNCGNIFGFTQPVPCGEKGPWIRCKKRSGLLALDCEVAEQKLETQLCK
jgi:hypothetical protein